MTLTALNIITDAMSLCGAVAIDESLSSTDQSLGLRVLNTMLDSWSGRRLLLRSTVEYSFNLVPNQYNYTIGASGANFTGPKPIDITQAWIVDSSNIREELLVVSKQMFNSYSDALVSTGRAEALCYDPNQAQQPSQKGNIFVYPIPDQAYNLHYEADVYLSEFSSVNDTVTFEPAYYEALVYNLALRLWSHYHNPTVPIPNSISSIAHESKHTIEIINSDTPRCGLDLPSSGSRPTFNIYNDTRN